jgi:mRNA interferase MazF
MMRRGMSCSPGELVAIPFPYSDLRTKKKRPVLVITPPDHHDDFIGLAITSVRTQGLSVPIGEESMASGRLPKPSWIRCDKVFTLRQEDIVGCYGTLKEGVLLEAIRTACENLGCGT